MGESRIATIEFNFSTVQSFKLGRPTIDRMTGRTHPGQATPSWFDRLCFPDRRAARALSRASVLATPKRLIAAVAPVPSSGTASTAPQHGRASARVPAVATRPLRAPGRALIVRLAARHSLPSSRPREPPSGESRMHRRRPRSRAAVSSRGPDPPLLRRRRPAPGGQQIVRFRFASELGSQAMVGGAALRLTPW